MAFLPPNSKDSFLNIGAAVCATIFPVDVPPVNEIALICGCSRIAWPALGPSPCITLMTPDGNWIDVNTSHNKFAVRGVSSLGFATMVLPMTKAGAIFQVSKYSGKFHGVISPTTPTGFLIT